MVLETNVVVVFLHIERWRYFTQLIFDTTIWTREKRLMSRDIVVRLDVAEVEVEEVNWQVERPAPTICENGIVEVNERILRERFGAVNEIDYQCQQEIVRRKYIPVNTKRIRIAVIHHGIWRSRVPTHSRISVFPRQRSSLENSQNIIIKSPITPPILRN